MKIGEYWWVVTFFELFSINLKNLLIFESQLLTFNYYLFLEVSAHKSAHHIPYHHRQNG